MGHRSDRRLALRRRGQGAERSGHAAPGHEQRRRGRRLCDRREEGWRLRCPIRSATPSRGGELVEVLAPFSLPPLPIQAVYPSSRLVSNKVRAFVDMLDKTADWRFSPVKTVDFRRRGQADAYRDAAYDVSGGGLLFRHRARHGPVGRRVLRRQADHADRRLDPGRRLRHPGAACCTPYRPAHPGQSHRHRAEHAGGGQPRRHQPHVQHRAQGRLRPSR